MISLLLLGRPEVLRDGVVLTLARRKSRALLFYLTARRAATPREQVIDLFWPDLSRVAAQQTLRTTLYGLRKALGPALEAGDALAVAAGADVDIWQLDAALAAGEPGLLEAALGRSRGPFLDGFSLPDTPAFDEWAHALREQYRADVVRGYAVLGRAYEQRGALIDALDALDSALALDPLREDVQRDALRVQYLAGDRVGAIRRYEQLRKRLDDELGVPPMAETRAVYDAIITDNLVTRKPRTEEAKQQTIASLASAPVPPPVPSPLPFIGRQVELQAVRQLASARQLVLVEGEPGIGKTRLVSEFLRESHGLVLLGAARELDQALPYQPVVEALRSLIARDDWEQQRRRLDFAPVWTAEVSRLVPELAQPDTPTTSGTADEARVREGVSQFLRALARLQPVALFFDDLHWADAATLGMLSYLVRQQLNGVVLLAAVRSIEPRAPLASLVQGLTREGRLGRLRLARLGEADTRLLARELSPGAADALAAWLLRNGEGNPYILAELVRAARDAQILRSDGTLQAETLIDETPMVPPTIYTLIASRLLRLSEPARRMLDAAVAAGREFDGIVVAHAAALGDEAALDIFDELVQSGLIRPIDERRYAFDHSLTMEVAYQEVGEARHRLIHRRVAEAMESIYRRSIDDVAGLIATHFLESRAAERAAPYALRAARRAAGLAAWTEAIGFFRQAIDGIDDQERSAVLLELGLALHRSGDHSEARDVYRAALELARTRRIPDAIVEAQLGLAQVLVAQSHFADVIAIARQLAGAEEPLLAARAELLWGTALSLEGADLEGAAAHLELAEALLHDARDDPSQPTHLAHAFFELGSVLAQQGDLTGAIARYRQALDASGERDVEWPILVHNNIAYHLLLLGDREAEAYARTGLRLAQERGAIGLQPFLLSTLGEIALAHGDLVAAEGSFAAGLALAERLNIPERVAGLGANAGLLAARRGQTALAIHRLSVALAQADALGTRHLAAQIRIWLAPLLPPDAARTALIGARAIAESGGRRRLLDDIARVMAQLEQN